MLRWVLSGRSWEEPGEETSHVLTEIIIRGERVDVDKVVALFQSRRVYAAVIGIVAVIFQQFLGLSEGQALEIAGVLAAFILGDSIRRTE
jgi:hypothetical protein